MCRRPRKTFKKKSSAKKAAKGKSVYKVKGGVYEEDYFIGYGVCIINGR